MIQIHNIGGYIVKNYLLETPIGIIAIDTGYTGGFTKFKARFEKKMAALRVKIYFSDSSS